MQVVSNWQDRDRQLFGKHTLLLQHRLAETGLFEKETLAKLIENYPSEHYNLTTMGFDPQNPEWREGWLGDLSGADVIKAIENGRMWLNLRRVHEVDARYGKMLSDIYDEFASLVPGFDTFRQNLGILISSPNVRVFYHADVPGQSLWQIEGKKRVYVYPNTEPFLSAKALEGIILGETEEEIPYEDWYDDHADVYDLGPGEMLHWPLNGPHRVDNADCLNISVTTEHYTDEIRKSYAVNYANGVLRRNFGMQNPSRATDTMAVYPKAALALAWKKLKLADGNKFRRMADFKPDPDNDKGIVDIPAFER